MRFKNLKIRDWKQFDAIDIDFHDRLTVLTGANGSGKTTLLHLLGRHFGWGFEELATPAKEVKTGKIKYITPIHKSWAHLFDENYPNLYSIGEITYSNGGKANITVLRRNSPVYRIDFPTPMHVEGVCIPSERSEFAYKQVSQIPTTGIQKAEAFNQISESSMKRISFLESSPSSYRIKETLIGWGIFGFGNEVITPVKEYVEIYRGFEDILRQILPGTLGFEKFEIRGSEVVLITKSGEFMIDAVSGGIGALIDLAWQIYMFSENDTDPFTVLIDEVETHLHGTMQRRLLPSFLQAFPNVQFIISTHSPLIVGSVKDSNVYVLKWNEEYRVESVQLDITNKARDAVDILRDVLGVPFTMPIWVEEKLNEINKKYSKLEITEEMFAALRKELSEIGLEDLVPYSIDKILSLKK